VGAGYVGKCAPLARRHAPLIARRD
jgi:hypothetical protein